MASHELDVATPDGVCDSYLAVPDTAGKFPPVIFYMDGLGIRPTLHAMADRLAAHGYVVLLPNLFYRDGRAPLFDAATVWLPENRPRLMQLIQSLTPDAVVRDAGVFLDFLAARPEVLSGHPAGLTGYCMGGAIVMRTAAHYPDRVAAGASFHGGRLATDAPESPHRLLGLITAELYFGHADQDPGMPAAEISRLEEALRAEGNRFQSELYSGALHGFTMADVSVYSEAAGERHWERLVALFERNLKRA